MPKKGLLSVDQAISAIVKKILPLKKEEKIKLSDSLGTVSYTHLRAHET